MKTKLESIRESLRNESISIDEILYLRENIRNIDTNDLELIQAAGLSEENYNTILNLKNLIHNHKNRVEIIEGILDYAGDEYKSKEDLITLAKMTDEQLIDSIYDIIDYYYEDGF